MEKEGQLNRRNKIGVQDIMHSLMKSTAGKRLDLFSIGIVDRKTEDAFLTLIIVLKRRCPSTNWVAKFILDKTCRVLIVEWMGANGTNKYAQMKLTTRPDFELFGNLSSGIVGTNLKPRWWNSYWKRQWTRDEQEKKAWKRQVRTECRTGWITRNETHFVH